MSSAIRIHVDELDFFSIYRGLSLVFKRNRIGIIEKNHLICTNIKKAYNKADDYKLYDHAAYFLKDTRQAILRSMAHISQSRVYHISSFNPTVPSRFETYSLSKMTLLRDIEEKAHDLINQIKTGKLYTKIQQGKTSPDTELLGYINVYYPIVEIAKQYKQEDPYFDIFNAINKTSTDTGITTVEKISIVLSTYIEKSDENLSRRIKEIFKEINQNKPEREKRD